MDLQSSNDKPPIPTPQASQTISNNLLKSDKVSIRLEVNLSLILDKVLAVAFV